MAAADGQREKQIANDIKEEFCKRVIPSDLIRHLQCLTKDDIDKVLEDEEKHGPMHAADVLLQRIVEQSDWLSHLKAALLNPDAGLVDFGERMEQMCVNEDQAETSPFRLIGLRKSQLTDFATKTKKQKRSQERMDDLEFLGLDILGCDFDGPWESKIKKVIINKKPTITHSPQNPPPPPPPPNHPI